MGPFRSVVAPACLALLTLLSVNASAEDLETVVVTAARTPVLPDEVGSSITVITAEDIERRQVASIADILRDVPGFAISRSGGPGSNTQIRVRGAEANQLLVLIDGIEANDLAQGSEFNFANILTDGIERIEVIRGPQSALWGSDAVAGVVNIITKQGTGALNVGGFIEGGSFSTVRGGGSVGAGTDQYRFNLSGSVQDSDGTNVSRQGDEKDGFDIETVSFNGGYTPIPELEFTVNARHETATSEFDDVDFFVTGLPIDTDSVTETEQDYAGAHAKLNLLDRHWEHRLAFTYTGTGNDNFTDDLSTGSGDGKKYHLEYQTSYLLESPNFWDSRQVFTFAAEYEREEFKQRGTATPFGDPNQDLDLHSTGIVGEYRIRFADSVSFSAGVRHDDNSAFANATTLRFTAAWAPAMLPGTRLHASWGEGVKNPTFSDRFGFFADSDPPFVGNPDLKPESSEGWDAGFEQEFMDGRARLGATYFHERLEDEINSFVFDPVRLVFTAINTDGRSHRQGVEVTGNAELAPGFSINGNYTWLDATEPDPAGGQSREVRRPSHMATFGANYVFAAERANVNLNVNYNGDQTDLFFPPFPLPTETVTLNSYTLVTLAASWKWSETISLFGRIENLLDDDYENVFGFQGTGIGAFAGIRIGLQP